MAFVYNLEELVQQKDYVDALPTGWLMLVWAVRGKIWGMKKPIYVIN